MTNAYICIGFPLAFGLGAILPTDKDEMVDDERWRIIYGVPAIVSVVQILLFLLVVRQEPVAFSIADGREEEAKALLRKIYKKSSVDNFEEAIN